MTHSLNSPAPQGHQRLICALVAGLIALCVTVMAQAQQASSQPTSTVPTTLSPEAQKLFQAKEVIHWENMPAMPKAEDAAAWKRISDAIAAKQVPLNQQIAARERVTLTDITLGDVPVVEILPATWNPKRDTKRVIVYFHGGAYTVNSARSHMEALPALANATGMRVLSVDYTLAPVADWRLIQSQALAVIHALRDQGYAMKHIALMGDSAGGGLATSTVLNLRNQKLGSPGAVVLWSPWTDLTNAGDTTITLKDFDPMLNYEKVLKTAAQAYAKELDFADPRVSPLYADFSKGFAPTLIQEGTRVIFLSSSVRLYRKLDAAGLQPVIDMYEGMPHVFQSLPIPEATLATQKSADFIRRHLQ